MHFFAREARRRGHHVDIITSNIPGAEPQPNVIRLGRSQPVYMQWLAGARHDRLGTCGGTMRQVLRRGHYDIVHVHSPLTPMLPILAIEEAELSRSSAPSTRISIGRSATRSFDGFFQKRLDMLPAAIAVSHSTTVALDRYFERRLADHPERHRHRRLPSERRRRRRACDKDVPTILFLGRFDPRNGLSDADRFVPQA